MSYEGSLALRKAGKGRAHSSLPEFFVTAQWASITRELVTESPESTLAMRREAQGEETGD